MSHNLTLETRLTNLENNGICYSRSMPSALVTVFDDLLLNIQLIHASNATEHKK